MFAKSQTSHRSGNVKNHPNLTFNITSKMSLNMNRLFKKRSFLIKICENKHYATAVPKVNEPKRLIISCRRNKYNFYSNTFYDKFDETILASKGWTHNKSVGDHFTVHPNPEDAYEHVTPFSELEIHPLLVGALQQQGIKDATDFQRRSFSTIAQGEHSLLAAETGCGKTVAYLVPIIQGLIERKTELLNNPSALIIVPNRELVFQIKEIAQALGAPFNLKVGGLVGGNTKKIMMNPVFDEIDVLVATPGVIGKLSTVGVYKLNRVLYTVLDEADTLTDDSFIERLAGIVRKIPQSQMILVSATLPKFLPDCLKPIEERLQHVVSPKIHKPLMNITQKFLRLTRSGRPGELLFIARAAKTPLLVFTNNSKTCDWLAMFLRENKLPCANINGEMNREIRTQQWNDFVSGRAKILSATDVVSRGLDLRQISHVLNYDFPKYMADYLHRIGRTGRFGSPVGCRVTNFVAGVQEVKLVQAIEMAIRRGQPLPYVDGNTTGIFQRNILKQMRETG